MKLLDCTLRDGGYYTNWSFDDDFVKRYSEHTPMKRMMNVDELNGLLNFLCSKESSYMTGENVKVDGGWTSW